MRVLLDESVPRPFGREPWADGHEVQTVGQIGWSGIRNGALLQRAAAAGFDILVTADRNLEFQQNLSGLRIAVLVLIARTNRLEDLQPLSIEVERALVVIDSGQVIRVGTESWKRTKRIS